MSPMALQVLLLSNARQVIETMASGRPSPSRSGPQLSQTFRPHGDGGPYPSSQVTLLASLTSLLASAASRTSPAVQGPGQAATIGLDSNARSRAEMVRTLAVSTAVNLPGAAAGRYQGCFAK